MTSTVWSKLRALRVLLRAVFLPGRAQFPSVRVYKGPRVEDSGILAVGFRAGNTSMEKVFHRQSHRWSRVTWLKYGSACISYRLGESDNLAL